MTSPNGGDSPADDSVASSGDPAGSVPPEHPHGPTVAGSLQDLLRSPRFWAAPLAAAVALLSLLAVSYFGGVANPQRELHDFPIALVNNDVGDPVTTDGVTTVQNIGDQIADQVAAGIDPNQIDLRRVGIDEAEHLMDTAQIYGMIVISGDFTKTLRNFGAGGIVPGDLEKPVITVYTNPRMGASSAQFVTTVAGRIDERLQASISEQLLETVNAALQPGQQLTGATMIAFQEPVNIVFAERFTLPEGSGAGLSAFYVALLLLLAGFTGSMVIHTLVDGRLGVIPIEYGPIQIRKHVEPASRVVTLLIKWTIVAVYGVVMSGLFVLIADLMGMNTPNAIKLWVFGSIAIFAVGVTSMSILAIVGNAGLLVNLILFVALGLPSAGATIPLEASPPIYTWFAEIIPLRQVFLGTRSILYFDATFASGLGRALVMSFGATIIAVVIGLLVTWWFDKRGYVRTGDPAPRKAVATGA
ncbi:ABC transporter permease [Millisia brevis]|uniref:ABC transporter permease n=1 Tax=Millisia brevis TaxID=264148 RepID=UPI00082B1D85|nr:ABC transporter permease [Millisia brevis]